MMKLEPRNSLFVYGTLMAPPVIQTLLGRVPPHGTAILQHYRRHPVRHQVYPGMIPQIGAMTQGILYHGLTPKEIARLDWFEDVEYARRPVIVTMGTEETATDTYVWTNPLSELQLDSEWSIEDFSQTHLTRFLEKRFNRVVFEWKVKVCNDSVTFDLINYFNVPLIFCSTSYLFVMMFSSPLR